MTPIDQIKILFCFLVLILDTSRAFGADTAPFQLYLCATSRTSEIQGRRQETRNSLGADVLSQKLLQPILTVAKLTFIH